MAIISALILVSSLSCNVQGAHYQYDADKGVTAHFETIPSDPKSLYLIVSDSAGHKLWFTLDSGSAASSVRFVSSKSDPGLNSWKPQDPDSSKDRLLPDQRYFLFTKNGSLAKQSLSLTSSAPDVVFIPDLAEQTFYRRDPTLFKIIPQGMFRLKSCGSTI